MMMMMMMMIMMMMVMMMNNTTTTTTKRDEQKNMNDRKGTKRTRTRETGRKKSLEGEKQEKKQKSLGQTI